MIYVEDHYFVVYLITNKGYVGEVYDIGIRNYENELDWISKTKFAEGIKKTIQWYMYNKEW